VELSGATMHGLLHVQGHVNTTLRLHQAICHDSVEVQVDSLIHIQANGARFYGKLSIQALEVGSLDLYQVELRRGLVLRGRYVSRTETRFDQSKIRGHLDFRDSNFGRVSFREVVFDGEATLDFTGSRLHEDLILAGLPTLPREITLDRAIIDGNVRIETLLGAPRPRVIATQQHPRFSSQVTFMNVDLRDCLLVGNVFDRIELSNVEWPRHWGRYVIRDEIVYRRNGGVPLSNLREAYQALKQKYHNKGDHVRAGDFHYGEMEMKRREYGFPRRWFSWEFVYWCLSGYGVGHLRALFNMFVLVVSFAVLYYWTSCQGTFSSFSEALRYSVGVAALQRPEMPTAFDEPQKWLHVLEAILAPVQIALFALALRLRLKR